MASHPHDTETAHEGRQMNVTTAFRNLDPHGRHRGPEVIAHEAALLEQRLARFRPDLVHLEASVSQTRGKKRLQADLRLELPSGVIAARADGFETEPVLRKAFAALGRRLDRHLALLQRRPEWKRPARRARIGRPLPPARDRAEAERRALYFELIEDHLDQVYNTVRRELTYLEASGAVPVGSLSVRGLVDATILAGLDRFEQRPTEFSIGGWLTRLAYQTIESEARAARRALPEGIAPLDEAPDEPAREPTEADQELYEFYQPDEMLLLEDLVADDEGEQAEDWMARREAALALHRALADLPALWRKTFLRLHSAGRDSGAGGRGSRSVGGGRWRASPRPRAPSCVSGWSRPAMPRTAPMPRLRPDRRAWRKSRNRCKTASGSRRR